ncbi:MAG: hypothetical protein KatS3mg111_2251 [Pirellulaceae bacterium]|nr:MAG: hypothetical protein KatS3mg111_2251 [Pirellulaceae bacterium]
MRSILLSIAITITVATNAHCQSRSHAWWNPLGLGSGGEERATSTTEKTSSFFGNSRSKSWFNLPRLLPSRDSATASISDDRQSVEGRPSAAPSFLERVGGTAKNMWTSTVDLLNPFDDSAKKPPAKSSLFGNQGYQPQKEREEAKSRPWFGWWSRSEKEEPRDINEFLSLPRPEF